MKKYNIQLMFSKDFIYKMIFLIVGGFSVLLSSCSTDANDVVAAGERPIVEAYLVPNKPVSVVVTKEIAYTITDSVASTPIDGLSISIKDDSGKVFYLKNTGKGTYVSANNELINIGRTYSMAFSYNSKTVSASTTIPSKPQNFAEDRTSLTRTQINLAGGFQTGNATASTDDRTPVYLTWANPNNDYYFVVVDNLETILNPIVVLPATTDGTSLSNFIRRFRNQPVQGTSDEVRPQNFQYFGNHQIILFHINPDYAALYQSTGSTTQNISTPPTSVVNGMGIFTGVNSDTLKFIVYKK